MTGAETGAAETGAAETEGAPATVTDELFAVSPLEPLPGPEGTAERLVLLMHRGVDWDVWGGSLRARYWEALAERVRAGTYAGPTLADWWERVTVDISSKPRTARERAETAALLEAPDQRMVLAAFRSHANALVLRCRVTAEARRAANTPAPGGPVDQQAP